VTDLPKILTAVNELDDPRLEQWSAYEEEHGLENLTYQDFCNFLKHLIKDPGMLRKEAALRYNEAIQQPHQTVREFALYMQQ
jgi:hypothetical protein